MYFLFISLVGAGQNRGSVLGYIVSIFSLYFIIWRFGAGQNRGSVLGYIVSIFSLYFIIWRFGAGQNRGSVLGYIVSMFAPVSFCAPHVNLCSYLAPAS